MSSEPFRNFPNVSESIRTQEAHFLLCLALGVGDRPGLRHSRRLMSFGPFSSPFQVRLHALPYACTLRRTLGKCKKPHKPWLGTLVRLCTLANPDRGEKPIRSPTRRQSRISKSKVTLPPALPRLISAWSVQFSGFAVEQSRLLLLTLTLSNGF